VELPSRDKQDRFVDAGQYTQLQTRIRRQMRDRDIPVLFVYSFDHRTRLGPFLFIDKILIPGGPIAVGAALRAAGFENTRIVLEQWTPNVRVSQADLGGQQPEMLFVSSMQIHSASAYRHIRDAWRLGDERPLILAGGPKAIYEPWDFFGLSADGRVGADVVVTGEDFVILELMDRLLEHQAMGETMRDAFERCRRAGLLDDIPGLVFRPTEDDAHAEPQYLVSTGTQRMVQDLGELPLMHEALGLFEPPHRRHSLARQPVAADHLRRHGRILGVVATRGCKFRCKYCPIPAYNQFAFRYKAPERVVEEMALVAETTGIHKFFGTDDIFFNQRDAVEEIFSAMARGRVGRRRFRDAIWFGTEATEFDVHKNLDLLPLARDAGCRAIWFGIEDMTAELVKKGQSPEKTQVVFREMRKHDILPMPMMMHHDGQPLWSREGLYGLLNQVRFLRKAGAASLQVTSLTPSVGSKLFEPTFRDGLAMDRVAGQKIEDYQFDGNHCVATDSEHPLRKQLNIFTAYAAFYNPLNAIRSALTFDSLWSYRMFYQTFGMLGVVKSIKQAFPWMKRLARGPIEKATQAPQAKYPLVVIEPGFDPHHAQPIAKALPILGQTASATCG
jgi:radical SAM superfamily enzyme YgiQ (UPF0313 family)